MVNAMEEFNKNGKSIFLKTDKILENTLNKIHDDEFSKYIDVDKIKENEFNLNVAKYVFKNEIVNNIDIDFINTDIKNIFNEIFNKSSEITAIIGKNDEN